MLLSSKLQIQAFSCSVLHYTNQKLQSICAFSWGETKADDHYIQSQSQSFMMQCLSWFSYNYYNKINSLNASLCFTKTKDCRKYSSHFRTSCSIAPCQISTDIHINQYKCPAKKHWTMKTYKQSMNTIVSSHIFPYKECIFTQYAHCTETSCAWQQYEEACPLKLYNPYNAQSGG